MTNLSDRDIFQELFQYWRKIRDPMRKHYVSRLLLEAKEKKSEIDEMSRQRHIARLMLQQKGNINGNLLTGEIHSLEYAACVVLCPALRVGTGPAKKEGWRWILKQPWGRDFRAAPFEKRHSG